MKQNVFFVSGIDTNIGKSYATAYLAHLWNKQGCRTITQKFIQTGNPEGYSEDIELHRRLMGTEYLPEDEQGLTKPEIFSYPASPHLASRIDNRAIDFDKIKHATEVLSERYDAVLVEVNSETDFVAKNPEFVSLVDGIANVILDKKPANMEEAMKLELDGTSIEEAIVNKTATIGEKLSFRRFELVEKTDNQVFGTYSHMGGKIVTLALLEGNDTEVAKDIAMQIAAMRPLYLDRESVPEERIQKEREILTEQAENEGLDSNKLPMIVNGRLNKFFEEICLVDQGFVKENKMKVSKYVESKNMKILSFVRYEVGEGMEKKEENFADEVAKQING